MLPFAKTWMDPEGIMFSKTSHTYTTTPCDPLYMESEK